MDAATKRRLRQGAEALGVSLGDSQVARLDLYVELLREWNARINLTSVTDPEEVVDRHLLDSLAVVPLAADADTLVDVGSGAGFPGAVLAVAIPGILVTCVESIRKKVAFLQTLRRELGISLEPICGRVEQFRGQSRQFAVAVSRATWDPAQWLTEGAPLVRPGGVLIAMQGSEQPELSAPVDFSALPVRSYAIGVASRRLVPFRRN
jgi:16S rRNA (guanine527-N7)-methyltransferase